MNIHKTLRELYAEKKRLDAAIAGLEKRLGPKPRKSRRGRKSMSAAERRDVSERMKRYWEVRRAQKQASEATENQASSGRAPIV